MHGDGAGLAARAHGCRLGVRDQPPSLYSLDALLSLEYTSRFAFRLLLPVLSLMPREPSSS